MGVAQQLLSNHQPSSKKCACAVTEMSQVALRRDELYGPSRILGREAAKKLHQEDHVKLNILKGVDIDKYDSRDTFSTVSSESYRVNYRFCLVV